MNSCWSYEQNYCHISCASSTMWGFTGQFLSSQKFPSPGDGFILVNICTSCLSFHTNAVKPSFVFTRTASLFNFNFFGPKSGSMSFLFGRTVPHEFIFLVSKSPESLFYLVFNVYFVNYVFSIFMINWDWLCCYEEWNKFSVWNIHFVWRTCEISVMKLQYSLTNHKGKKVYF
jgi:hypothetical protein